MNKISLHYTRHEYNVVIRFEKMAYTTLDFYTYKQKSAVRLSIEFYSALTFWRYLTHYISYHLLGNFDFQMAMIIISL